MSQVEVPVLIVGAGPVGMMASILLERFGIGSLVVERREGPHRAPQAHMINPRSLEICRQARIDVDRLRALATPRADGSEVAWVTTLTGQELGRLPYERQGDDMLEVTPTPMLNLSQHLFEPVLLEHMSGVDGVEVRYRHQWSASRQDGDGVVSRVVDLGTGREYEIRSRYLLAADGAGSAVRKSLGIEMTGPTEIQSFVMIHFEAALRPLVGERPAILFWTVAPDCLGTFVAHDIDSTWVFMHPWKREVETADSYTPERCAAIVRRAIGRDDVDFRVRNVSTWTMTAQVADGYASGRTFLIGDSAHRFPPSGGMGMNTGIQDAHNLAWKLAAVEQGWAGRALLDSYEIERRPIAQENAEQSLANALKLLEVFAALGLSEDLQASRDNVARLVADARRRDEVRAAIESQREHFDMVGLHLGFCYEAGAIVHEQASAQAAPHEVSRYVATTRPGARLPHAWVVRDGARSSVLDLVDGSALVLLVGSQGQSWVEAAADGSSARLVVLEEGRDFVDPDGTWASVREVGASGAILVRPDQHVAWRAPRWTPAGGGELRAALAKVLQAA